MPNQTAASHEAHAPIDSYLNGIKHLPPTPTLMIKLIELFRQPDGDVDAIVSLIRRDPALATELLRRCNNSFFGNDAPVIDIHEAVFRLGFYEVYHITVALFGLRALNTKQELPGFPLEALRQHSSITAVASSVIATEVAESEGTAFTTGLLHDVGKVVLAAAGGPDYIVRLQSGGAGAKSTCEFEKDLFGFTHGEAGARLLQRWGVPDVVAIPVLGHHQPSWNGPLASSVAILNLANRLAHHIQRESAEKIIAFCELPEVVAAMKLLQLTPSQIPGLAALVRHKIKQKASLLTA